MLEAAAAAKTLQETIDGLHGRTIEIGLETSGAAAAAATTAVNGLANAENHAAAAALTLGDRQRSAADGAIAAGAAAGAAAGGWRIFGVAAGTVLHWVVAAGAEFLAVAIPAAIALGAAMLVAAQGAQMVQEHMSALYTATEATANMFHTTIGSALGLHSALQQAQDAANPVVFSVLGGVINILKSNFQDLAGAGLQVMRIFQTFTARVVADFQAGFGDQIHGLLSGMVTDLVMFGQVLGNVGHALLNFAAAMPGLAEVLLGLVDAASHVLLWFSQMPAILITVAMAMEEVWRWGGPLAGILTRIPALLTAFVASGFGIGPVFARVAQIFQALLLIVPRLGLALGEGLAALAGWAPKLGAAGAAIGGFSRDVGLAIAGLSTFELALGAIAVGGLAFLIIKALGARTAIQQMTDSMQQSVDKASGMRVFGDIAGNMARLIPVQEQAAATEQHWSQVSEQASQSYGRAASAAQFLANQAAASSQQVSAGMRQQQRDMINAAQAVTFLSHAYGVSFVGALALGTQAGVQWDQGIGKMSAAAEINLIKVQDLMAGYRAMGQPAGAVGTDMTAVAIQAGLQSSKIQQLTQAWQSYMTLLTGGTNSLATFEQGLSNIGTVAASSAGRLFEAQGKMNASTQQFAASLQSFTGRGAQNWQNFNQVVSTGAEQFINWMQTAGAVGAVSGPQMSGAIKGVVAQLIPFASHSQAARAELAGLAAQTGAVVPPTMRALEAFAKGGMSAKQLGQFVQDATAKLSDMAGVAAHLGDVMQSDLVAMFDKARLAASGLPGALNTLSNSIQHTGMTSQATQGALVQVIQRLMGLHQSLPTVTALLNSMGYGLTQAQVKAVEAAMGMDKTAGSAGGAAAQMRGETAAAQALAAAIASLHSRTLFVNVVYSVSGGVGGIGGATPGVKIPGAQAGGYAAYSGWHVVGEMGPEIRWLNMGDYISNAQDTQRFLSSPVPATGGGPSAGGSAGGGGTLHATVPVHVFLDGQQVFESVKTQTARYNVRNGNPQSGRLSPGA